MGKEYINLKVMIAFAVIFAFGGFLHVFFYGVDGTTSLFQLYYCVIALLWGNYIRQRIIEKRIKKLLSFIVLLLVLFFVQQAGRFAMFNYAPVTERYIWYAYYIIYTLVPCLFLQVGLEINRSEKGSVKIISHAVYVIAILEGILVLTNDIHRWVFIFPDGLANADTSYRYGVLYYVIIGTEMIFYLVSLGIIIYKCRVKTCRKQIWMPLVFSIVGVVGIILSFLDKSPQINGIRIWSHAESYMFLVIGVIESCIDIGLIPSNVYYNRMFWLVNVPGVVQDNNGRILFYTNSAQNGIEETDDLRVYTKNISGGTVSYGVDISSLNKLNRDLDEANEKVKIRNEYLNHQNDLKEEQLKLQTRNGIYDKIAGIVKPQLDKTLELSNNPDSKDFEKKLAKIAFYNVYIKRRSNMELLCESSDTLPVKELATAVSESIEYLKLSGVLGMARINEEAVLQAESVILFYDFFQNTIENCLDSLSEMFVTLRHKGNRYILNLVLKTDEKNFDTDWKKDEIKKYDGKISVSDDEDGTVVSLSLEKGGDDDDVR